MPPAGPLWATPFSFTKTPGITAGNTDTLGGFVRAPMSQETTADADASVHNGENLTACQAYKVQDCDRRALNAGPVIGAACKFCLCGCAVLDLSVTML